MELSELPGTWVTISFPVLGKFLTVTSSNTFSGPFSFSSFLGIPIMQMLVHLMLFQRSLRLFSFLFFAYSLFCSMAMISITLSFSLFILLQLFCYWFFLMYSSFQLLYCSLVSLFFNPFGFTLNISLNFSICVSVLFPKILDHLYYHYSTFFQRGCLSPFHLVVLMGLSCSFICNMSYVNLSVCGLLSTLAGSRYLLLLGSAPPVVRLVQGLLQASRWEGLMPAFW